MKRRRHKLLIALAFLLYIILLSACQEQKKERVCVHIITPSGREYTTGFMLPVNRSPLQVNAHSGTYALEYVDERWWDGHWKTVKVGVEDFSLTGYKY